MPPATTASKDDIDMESPFTSDMSTTDIKNILKSELKKTDTLPMEELLHETLGKCVLMFPRLPNVILHPAEPLLQEYASDGCPVHISPSWTKDHLVSLLEHGPHSSALEPDAIRQICEETQQKVEQGYARLICW